MEKKHLLKLALEQSQRERGGGVVAGSTRVSNQEDFPPCACFTRRGHKRVPISGSLSFDLILLIIYMWVKPHWNWSLLKWKCFDGRPKPFGFINSFKKWSNSVIWVHSDKATGFSLGDNIFFPLCDKLI